MYVWSNKIPVGTVIEHPRSDRIRMSQSARCLYGDISFSRAPDR
jgi:hypothetical protein